MQTLGQKIGAIAATPIVIVVMILINMVHNHQDALEDMGLFQPVGNILLSLIAETGVWTTTFLLIGLTAIGLIALHLYVSHRPR